MKKCRNILILIFLFVQYFAQAQEINPNGYNIFYYPNGNISSEGNLSEGKPDGYWKSYYEDGVLKAEGNRRFFMLDSIWYFYFPDGNLAQKIYYRNDVRNGYTLNYEFYYDEDSVKQYYQSSKILYYNGKKEGLSFFYDKNSNLKYSYNYRNDKRHGIGKEFDKDSTVITIFKYFDSYLIDIEKINRFDSNNQKTGKWISFHPNGNKHIEKHYLNGKLNGAYIEYDLSENIILQRNYLNDKIYVLTEKEQEKIELLAKVKTTYYDDGKIQFQGAFIDSIPVGIHREFDETGKNTITKEYNRYGELQGEGFFDENGLRTGKWKLYDSKSKYFYGEGEYKNGNKHGKWIYYFPNKEVEQEGSYMEGKQESEWKWYYKNGKIRKAEYFMNGKLEGEYVEYDKDGEVIHKGEYFDGAKQGEWFYNVGNIKKIGSFELDAKHGYWKHFYNDNGKLYFEGEFINGEPDGTHKYYYSNGNVMLFGDYRMGDKHKQWRKYTEDGELFITRTYRNGKMIKIDGKRIKIK